MTGAPPLEVVAAYPPVLLLNFVESLVLSTLPSTRLVRAVEADARSLRLLLILRTPASYTHEIAPSVMKRRIPQATPTTTLEEPPLMVSDPAR
jgi:hypothetical protein